MSAGKPEVKPVKLICGVLFDNAVDLDSVDKILVSKFGLIDHKSQQFKFTFTEYYNDEMGSNLSKQFYSFEKLVMPDSLADIKNETIEIETKFSHDGKRTVNLDPGYLEESKLVLASTKNFSHRIYLRDHIWAELTLRYIRGEFVANPWSYPDYCQDLAIEFLKSVRENYRNQLIALEMTR